MSSYSFYSKKFDTILFYRWKMLGYKMLPKITTDSELQSTVLLKKCYSRLSLNGHLYKTDTQCRSQRCPSQRELTVRLITKRKQNNILRAVTLLCTIYALSKPGFQQLRGSFGFIFLLSPTKVVNALDSWGKCPVNEP